MADYYPGKNILFLGFFLKILYSACFNGSFVSKKISVFILTMINIATILSIRNWPISAQYGLSSIVFLTLALLFFFIPAALVSAELATAWPQKGGIFVWVKEALGHRLGFLAVWLLWLDCLARDAYPGCFDHLPWCGLDCFRLPYKYRVLVCCVET